jgi:hypothetical protein
MPATTRSPQSQADNKPETTQTLAYWMGRVDANIGELKSAIDGFARKDDARWADFEGWRRDVDERLLKGSNQFDALVKIVDGNTRRLDEVEDARESKTQDAPSKAKFGTWDWFRDGYLERFVLIVLTLVFYKIIEIIVANWTITATLH